MMDVYDRVKPEEYAKRRRALLDRLDDNSVAVSFAGLAKVKSADEDYPFEVSKNFYYLTGIDQEDSRLLLFKCGGLIREYLFVSPYDERQEKWTGKRLTYAEAKEISDIGNVLPVSAFESLHEGALKGENTDLGEVTVLYLDRDRELKVAEDTSLKDYEKELVSSYPSLKVNDLYPFVTNLRLIKSPREINLLRRAIRATHLAINETVKAIAPGKREYELADTFARRVNDENGYQGLSFATIMASGVHAATLHYPTPLGILKEGDLVLMDLGGRIGYYCADISRTYPVNGKFEGLQKDLYELVLAANKNVISLARPGTTIHALQDATIDFLANGLLKLGLIDKKEDYIKYYFHSVSHFIGLDTHDPYQSVEGNLHYRDVVLEPGMVISDEPGLYLADKEIGIRIEDDLLITESGCVNLSEEIEKEIPAVEALMAK